MPPPPTLELSLFSQPPPLPSTPSPLHIRLEICTSRPTAGQTPPLALLASLAATHPHLHRRALLRPSPSDSHTASPEEFQHLQASLSDLSPYADGFVFGILTQSRTIDVQRCRQLTQRAAPKPCVFHRGFDHAVDRAQALEDVIRAGFSGVLTAGGPGNIDAPGNVERLRATVEQAGDRLEIIAGGGVRAANLARLMSEVEGVAVWHSSAISNEDGDQIDLREVDGLVAALCASNDTPGVKIG